MARISAGQDFGQQVAQPRRLNETATPRAAFGVTQGLQQEGVRMERQGLQMEREAQQAREAADRATAAAHLGVMRDRLGDLVGEIDAGVQDGSVPKTEAAKVWAERSQELLEEGLESIPEAHRGIARIDLDGASKRLASKVGDAVRRRDKADTLAGINTTLEYTQRLARENPAAARQQMAETLDALGPHAGLDANAIAKAKQGWIESTAYTNAFTAVTAAKRDNAALSKVEQGIAANEDLDPQRRAALLAQVDNYRAANEARAIREAQRAEIAAAKREREAGQAWNVLSGWALAGKAANPDAAAGLIAKLEGTPYAAAYKALAAEVPARTAAAMLPLDQQQRQLDALTAQRNAQGTSEALEAEIKRREQVLADARRDYAAEPLRAGAERGVIDAVQPLDVRSLDTMAAGLAGRVEQAQAVATRTGRPVSPLLTDEALQVGTMLNALPPAQRSQRIAQLAEVLPAGMAQALAKQIDGKDRALGLQLAVGTARTTEGRYTSELIARGAQAVKDKAIKEDTAAMTGLRAQLAEVVGDALPGKAREDVIDAARFIYLGMQSEGSADAARAVRLAVGGDIIEHNGRRVPVLAGVDLPQALRTLSPDQVLRQAPDGAVYLPGGRPMAALDFVAALPDAQLEPAGSGRYMVRSGGSLVMNRDARPIVIEVR